MIIARMVESDNGPSTTDTIIRKSTSDYNEIIEMETLSDHNDVEESYPTTHHNDEDRDSSSAVRHRMQERLCKFLIFHLVILVVVGVMQIPITLYYTNQSSNNFIVSKIIDLESCSVSYNVGVI